MILHFARFCGTVLNNPYGLGFLSSMLILVPIIGMWAVHKYDWQHWEPFDKRHD